MSERRYSDLGRPETAEDSNNQRSYLNQAGVLFGNALSIEDGDIVIAAGAVVSPDGVVIYNDRDRTLDFTPAADEALYTVLQIHAFENSFRTTGSAYSLTEATDGGVAVFVAEEEDSIILGWIRYPGGSVDLESYMIHPAPKLQIVNPSVSMLGHWSHHAFTPLLSVAPFADGVGCLVDYEDSYVTGAHSIDGTSKLPITTITNSNATTAKTVTLYLRPQRVALYRPKSVVLNFKTDAAVTSVAVSTINDGGEVVEYTFTGTIIDGEKTVVIDDQSITEVPAESGDPWGLKVEITIPALKTIVLRSIQVTAGPMPEV